MRCTWFLLAVMPLVPARAEAVDVALTFGETSVVASGITAGGSLVWFSVALEPSDWSYILIPRAEVAEDEDQDGAVEYLLSSAPAPKAVWVAVDLATGAAAIAAPPEGALAQVPFPAAALRFGAETSPDGVDPPGHAGEILLVRPGVGAWRQSAADGGPEDEDGEVDGKITSSLPGFEALGEAPAPPSKLASGDVVVILDVDTLEVATAVVSAEGGA